MGGGAAHAGKHIKRGENRHGTFILLLRDMNATVEHLKVDQTTLSLETSVIFLSNVNIPERYIDRLRPVLERISAFVNRDYEGIEDIRYQLTATYTIRNKLDGEVRQWTGSFLPRGNNNLSTIDSFHPFGPDFVDRLEQVCDRQSIIAKLLLNNADTKWEFDSLTGLVLNVQAQVPRGFNTLIRRDLNSVRHGHATRHVTFPLP